MTAHFAFGLLVLWALVNAGNSSIEVDQCNDEHLGELFGERKQISRDFFDTHQGHDHGCTTAEGYEYEDEACWQQSACSKCICVSGQIECYNKQCQEITCGRTERKFVPKGTCCPRCEILEHAIRSKIAEEEVIVKHDPNNDPLRPEAFNEPGVPHHVETARELANGGVSAIFRQAQAAYDKKEEECDRIISHGANKLNLEEQAQMLGCQTCECLETTTKGLIPILRCEDAYGNDCPGNTPATIQRIGSR